MSSFYTLDLIRDFHRSDQIPLYVEEVAQNHPEKRWHSHTFTELTLILRGEARHLLGKASSIIKKGDVLVLFPGTTHSYDETKDFALINLTYDFKKLSMPVVDGYEMPLFHRLFPSSGITFSEEEQCSPVVTLPEEKIGEIAQSIRNLQQELNDVRPGNYFLSLAKFMQIAAELARCSCFAGKHNWTMSKIYEAVLTMQKDPKTQLDVTKMAKMAMMSKRTFFRTFQSLTGCSPQEYRQQLRLKMATELLSSTDLQISEIAFQCGFYDANYFCRIFRRHFQTSPREYRKHHPAG